jgi:hypothetical protein
MSSTTKDYEPAKKCSECDIVVKRDEFIKTDMTKITDFRTLCCNAYAVFKGRANFRCAKCDKDVTMYVMFFAQICDDTNLESI